mgnify:CR=1 FL=1
MRDVLEPWFWLIGSFLGIAIIPISKLRKKHSIDLQKLKIEQCTKIFSEIGDIEIKKEGNTFLAIPITVGTMFDDTFEIIYKEIP